MWGEDKTALEHAKKKESNKRNRKVESDMVTTEISANISDIGAIIKKKCASSIIKMALVVNEDPVVAKTLKVKLIVLAMEM